MVRKLLASVAAGGAMLALVPGVFATGPVNGNFGGNGNGVWVNDYANHYVNTKNPANRKDWDNHRFAVPGQGGHHASDNAAVIGWGDGSLVDPQQTL